MADRYKVGSEMNGRPLARQTSVIQLKSILLHYTRLMDISIKYAAA